MSKLTVKGGAKVLKYSQAVAHADEFDEGTILYIYDKGFPIATVSDSGKVFGVDSQGNIVLLVPQVINGITINGTRYTATNGEFNLGANYVQDSAYNTLKQTVNTLNTTVSTLNTNLNTLSTRVGSVEGDVSNLETAIDGLSTSVQELGETVQFLVNTFAAVMSSMSLRQDLYTVSSSDGAWETLTFEGKSFFAINTLNLDISVNTQQIVGVYDSDGFEILCQNYFDVAYQIPYILVKQASGSVYPTVLLRFFYLYAEQE